MILKTYFFPSRKCAEAVRKNRNPRESFHTNIQSLNERNNSTIVFHLPHGFPFRFFNALNNASHIEQGKGVARGEVFKLSPQR